MFVAIAPALTLLVLIAPVAAGLLGTVLPALGWFPPLGAERFGLEPITALLATPGIGHAARVSLLVGLVSTTLSFALTVLFAAAFFGTRAFALLQRLLAPLLSVPHVAVAVGLAFLIAPSGLLVRLAAPALGLTAPPDLLLVHDRWGVALIAGLVLKETPFLFLMLLAALPQADAERRLALAATLGYRRIAAFLKVVLPAVYPQMRLPILAVLAFSVGVVDVAIVLGPTTPPTLPVQVLRWSSEADLGRMLPASAAALLVGLITVLCVLVWLAAERAAVALGRAWTRRGGRAFAETALGTAAYILLVLISTVLALSLLVLLLWSVARIWRFPDMLPATWTLAAWAGALLDGPALLLRSTAIALAAAALATVLVIGCLEHEVRFGRRASSRALWLLYLPLLVPQIAFLFGLQIGLIWTGLDASMPALVLAHLVFVLPYVFLSLADPWRAFDERYRLLALTLGASPNRALWRVRLPMLGRPLATAAAVGFAVSIGLYLPTVLVGGGRITTVTTEAVALASGGDRRRLAVYALLQAALPFIGFALAALAGRRRPAGAT